MIQLKLLTIEGFEEVVGWANEGTKDDLYQWVGPGYTYPLTLNQFEQRLRTLEVNSIESKVRVYGIYLTSQNELIGTFELVVSDEKKKTGSLGKIFIKKSVRGKGYCSLVMDAVCLEALEGVGLSQLFLKVFHFNQQGIRCYEKVGFRKINYEENVYQSDAGSWHRVYMMVTKDQWLTKKGETHGIN